MMDIFPFPKVMSGTSEERINELISYLIQFKETLEFALTNISKENLSPDLMKLLDGKGESVGSQKVNENSLTVFDVINSEAFITKIRSEFVKNVTFNVNFDTGNLEYTVD